MIAAEQFLLVTPMRERGGSGVQTYTNTFHEYLTRTGIKSTIVTPYSYLKLLVFPIFAIQKIAAPIMSEWSIGWGRYWRYFFLNQVLKRKLAQLTQEGVSTIVYAQCPVSAKAALDARKKRDQKIILIVHYNISQADEWADKGKIKMRDRIYKRIKVLEEELIPHLDGIVYVSNFMKNIIETSIPRVKSIHSVFLPCFTNKPTISIAEVPRRDLINIGTLENRKNQAYLLQVVAVAKQKGYS